MLLGVRCVIFVFGLFYAWAVHTRRSAPETHKRMMITATFVLADAGILRMPSYLVALALYAPFAMATALLWDSPAWLELLTRVTGKLIGE